ncbi:MAG: NADH-quinone oxidoreductase subunit N [Bacteroidia bacterium]|nr:NADH-quinone oxidoreductase subunit N [Bacteroidia bacterium]MDW8157828.1 NADH-quinone oxidoreductase subunit N [Bacteroidia bacterium]
MDISTLNIAADLQNSIPLLLLLLGGLVLMLIEAFGGRKSLPLLTALTLVVSIVSALIPLGAGNTEYKLGYSNSIAFGGVASLFHIFLCASALFALFFIDDYLQRNDRVRQGDIYPLLLFSTIGMVMLANGNDLIVLFIGLEIMSICLYIMAGMFPKSLQSNEAGLKYFLLGSFASAFLLYGISLIYGISGLNSTLGPTTQLDKLSQILPQLSLSPMLYTAMGLILIGFLFKVAAFPFHNWTPDVYTGAPTPLAGFMATGGKMAAFIAFSFFMMKIVPSSDSKITTLLVLFSVISMYYGNITALMQNNIKRVLAYSSIAHTGYMLLGLCSGMLGYKAVIFYMLVYTFMSIGAFGIVAMVENKPEDADLSNWKGLGMQKPWLGIAMSTFLFSLAGMPPLAGFMGKYFIFASAVKQELYVASVLGILSSVIGAYYYLRILVYMYFYKPDSQTITYEPKIVPMLGAIVLVVVILLIGIFPSQITMFLDGLYTKAGFMSSVTP